MTRGVGVTGRPINLALNLHRRHTHTHTCLIRNETTSAAAERQLSCRQNRVSFTDVGSDELWEQLTAWFSDCFLCFHRSLLCNWFTHLCVCVFVQEHSGAKCDVIFGCRAEAVQLQQIIVITMPLLCCHGHDAIATHWVNIFKCPQRNKDKEWPKVKG